MPSEWLTRSPSTPEHGNMGEPAAQSLCWLLLRFSLWLYQYSTGLMCMCLDTPACMYKHHPCPHKQAFLGYYLDLGMLSSLVWSTLGREGQERGLLWERKWLRVILAGNSRVQVQDTWSCRRNAGCGWACTLDSRKALLQEKGHSQRRPGIPPPLSPEFQDVMVNDWDSLILL